MLDSLSIYLCENELRSDKVRDAIVKQLTSDYVVTSV